jgi:alginate O-acetyltransferase complex protein AlgI
MSVCSIEFLLALLLASGIFFWLPGVRARQLFLATCSGAFLYSHLPDSAAWIALAIFVVTGYAAALILRVYPRGLLLGGYVALVVAAFVVLKQYDFLKAVLPPTVFARTIAVVGLSYMLFRQIHVAVDALQGQIERLSFWTYLNYQLNLFGLLAGPIMRYQEFQECWDRLEPILTTSHNIQRAYRRVFWGVLKVAAIAALCLSTYEWMASAFTGGSHSSRWVVPVKFLLLFYLYPAYIYFNFSGYCDIVIGGASLFGLKLPENFDRPFLSRNMIEFWTRWHETLGFWIRDYLFTPLYLTVAKRWPRRAPSLAFLCFFTALFVAGVWHGSTWNFVVFGVLNGVGVAAAKLWESYLVARKGRKGLRDYLELKSVRALAVAATFNFVCLTLFFVPGGLDRSLTIAKSAFSEIFEL